MNCCPVQPSLEDMPLRNNLTALYDKKKFISQRNCLKCYIIHPANNYCKAFQRIHARNILFYYIIEVKIEFAENYQIKYLIYIEYMEITNSFHSKQVLSCLT